MRVLPIIFFLTACSVSNQKTITHKLEYTRSISEPEVEVFRRSMKWLDGQEYEFLCIGIYGYVFEHVRSYSLADEMISVKLDSCVKYALTQIEDRVTDENGKVHRRVIGFFLTDEIDTNLDSIEVRYFARYGDEYHNAFKHGGFQKTIIIDQFKVQNTNYVDTIPLAELNWYKNWRYDNPEVKHLRTEMVDDHNCNDVK